MTCDVQVVYPHSIHEVQVSDEELMRHMEDAQLGLIVAKHGLLHISAILPDFPSLFMIISQAGTA